MTKPEQDWNSPFGAKCLHTPMNCFLVLACLNTLFWSSTTLGSFSSSSEDASCERFLMFGKTEVRLLSFSLSSTNLHDFILAGVISATTMALVLLCIKLPRHAPIVWFFVLTCLNALFWFTANFGSFHPSSEGPLLERLLMFGVTEIGPLSFFFLPMGLSDYVIPGVVSAVTIALVFLCTRMWRNKVISIALAIVTCIGICVWFYLGFSVAGLRIT